MTPAIDIVGLHGGAWYGERADEALRKADVLYGARRQHEDLARHALPGEAVELWGNIDELVERCAADAAAGRRVCVLAAGDPGFFGIARVMRARLGTDALTIHPAPSSIALAFARAGMPWDDAVVGTCHGRPLDSAVAVVMRAAKAAVLVSPETPPERLGQALVDAGCGPRHVWVCSHLGEASENVTRTDLTGLSAGTFAPLSVVLLVEPGAEVSTAAGFEWGRHESGFAHERGLVTKGEVRAIALGKLSLPSRGVLWDVGAGSGSVGVEAAMLAPALRVFAVERDPDACNHIRTNARGLGITVIEGSAPSAFAALPDPDRAFVGGGGLAVLDAVLARMPAGGRVVATFAVLAHAVAATERLGSLVQVSVARGVPIGADGGLRLNAENPVFVVWGDR